MKRIAGYFLLVTLLSLPAQAIGPLAFLAKDLVKGIVQSFVEGQIDKMLARAGPGGLPRPRPGARGAGAGQCPPLLRCGPRPRCLAQVLPARPGARFLPCPVWAAAWRFRRAWKG